MVQTTFRDVLKSTILDTAGVSLVDMLVSMALALCLGLFIYWIYRKTFSSVMYSTSFGVTLVALTMITTLVILAVTSNVVLSLGMVGALSIVRFRTAIKDPMDIVYLFWAIAAGIVLAAGLVSLALLGSLVIGIVILLLSGRKHRSAMYILAVSCSGYETEKKVVAIVQEQAARCAVKSKTVRKEMVEMNLEVRLRKDNADFVNTIAGMDGVESAVLVSYNGEYMS